MWRRAFVPAIALGILGVAAGTVLADPNLVGTFKLSSRRQGSAAGPRTEVRVWIQEEGAGYRITRQEVYPDGRGAVLTATGTASSTGWIRVNFRPVNGLANLPVFNPPTTARPYRGTYKVSGTNFQKIAGYFTGPDRTGQVVSRYESGERAGNEPVPTPGGANPGTNPGTNPGGGGTATTVAELGAKVVRVSVQTDIDISDAGESQFEQALDATAPTAQDPAAILKGQPLRARIFIASKKAPSAPLNAVLTGSVAGRQLFSQQVQLSGTSKDFLVASTEPLNAKVAINALNIEWKLDAVAAGSTAIRVYTIHARPVHNIANDRTDTATKRHFENACRWANGASKNIGQGGDSIAYQIDNQMRHYVHWEELGNLTPAVPDYPKNAAVPNNYADLSGYVSNGTRSISSLYYPPLEPDKDYEQYTHYRNNFGWTVLDNPTNVGGRCNQQASLVCAILGTVGIKGQVHYLERTGRGKRTGRPVRNYFFAQGGGGPWNFHGVARIDLDDGSQWIYDGSFSSPPNRKNGTKEWAENAGGPFVGSWADWYYEDFGGKVPADDRPDTWEGVQ